VRRGLVASRTEAQAAIAAGQVFVGGAPTTSAARLVLPGDALVVRGPGPRFASRGGEKLAAALDRFAVEVHGRHCLDAGASTGGFTDCLLQYGAASVLAVDVGHGQLHERLRDDPRVTMLERTNVRHLDLDTAGGRAFDIVVADLSFISLRTVFPALLGDLPGPGSDAVFLVKPQFEAGRVEVSRGRGVIRDPEIWLRVLTDIASSITEHGAVMMDAMASPLLGADGNVEFLSHVRPHAAATGAVVDLESVVSEAVQRSAG
jgi:23S rRNA (cytidine1920-2'-O)/16S rRNA (cytidine1409-2'-O)-methyltransferase